MKSFGMRHVALNVRDPQASKEFYTRVLKMEVEWEPDPDNVYLCTKTENGVQDNLAIHKAESLIQGPSAQLLDHIGFILPTLEDVDAWYAHVVKCGAKIVREIKTHRDGARSFYFSDLDGVVIQMIYHPPFANRRA